jgi:hypothetical protein
MRPMNAQGKNNGDILVCDPGFFSGPAAAAI